MTKDNRQTTDRHSCRGLNFRDGLKKDLNIIDKIY
jgi:hypothetical protein